MPTAATLEKKAAAKRAEIEMLNQMKRADQLEKDLSRTRASIDQLKSQSEYTSPGEVIGGIFTGVLILAGIGYVISLFS